MKRSKSPQYAQPAGKPKGNPILLGISAGATIAIVGAIALFAYFNLFATPKEDKPIAQTAPNVSAPATQTPGMQTPAAPAQTSTATSNAAPSSSQPPTAKNTKNLSPEDIGAAHNNVLYDKPVQGDGDATLTEWGFDIYRKVNCSDQKTLVWAGANSSERSSATVCRWNYNGTYEYHEYYEGNVWKEDAVPGAEPGQFVVDGRIHVDKNKTVYPEGKVIEFTQYWY